MISRKKLTDAEVLKLLTQLPLWRCENGRLHREIASGNFAKGVQWITRIAEVAEELNHHPDIVLTYTRVTVEIYTHDVGGITEFDFELARRIDSLAL